MKFDKFHKNLSSGMERFAFATKNSTISNGALRRRKLSRKLTKVHQKNGKNF
jgi:hypothetical protein